MMKTLVTLGLAFAIFATPPAVRAAGGPDTTQSIDTDCSAIQNAVMALKPVHAVLVGSKWKVMSEGDYAVAEQTRASITFVDAYKATKGYAWIATHTFGADGVQRATQLCFRQADGTLQRVRQASTLSALSDASAATAYFAPDGSVMKMSALFAVSDPAIAKKVADLPYYSQLP